MNVAVAPPAKLGVVIGPVQPLPEADQGPVPSPFARTCTRYSLALSRSVSDTGSTSPTSSTTVHSGESSAGSDAPVA